MKRRLNIKYHWEDPDEKYLIPKEHITLLEEDAWERIAHMIPKGYTSGELITNIDDRTYYGWWSVTKE